MNIEENIINQYPPLIRQFIQYQLKHPHAIILTEVGGFFEIWGLDELGIGYAKKASQILDTVLTRRNKSDPNSPRMTGFPSYTVDNYVNKLVAAGETVVVVKQEITGKKGDNNKDVQRFIQRIQSPGTSLEKHIDHKPNYFASIYQEEKHSGIALIDVSTGEVRITEVPNEELEIFLETNNPVEILFCHELKYHKKDHQISHQAKKLINRTSDCGSFLAKIYDIDNPTGNHSLVLTQLGIDMWRLAALSLANLLNFLTDYNPLLLKKIAKPEAEQIDKYLYLSKNSFMSLEIFDSPVSKDHSNTLYGTLDRCKTAMGRRILRKWLQHPLTDILEIKNRHEKVENFIAENNFGLELKEVYDIARITRRMALKNLMPHEIISFCQSVDLSKKTICKFYSNNSIDDLQDFIGKNINLIQLEKMGVDNYSFYQGDIEASLENEKSNWKKAEKNLLKETKRISAAIGSDKVRVTEKPESLQLNGPKSLVNECKKAKIEFKVKTNEIQIIDESWENAAVKEFSLRRLYILKAEKMWDKFQQDIVEKFGEELLVFSNKIGEYDVLTNFAFISKERNYSKPKMVESVSSLAKITKMRHPVVEISQNLIESFVPNDLDLNEKLKNIVIYGANSAGKSTILKSLAVNIIMAQVGCFVAAEAAMFSVFENIMTRMTTYDSLSEGISTFTMEMIELQAAIKKSNKKSLFLFDEIGRGTSVDDGEAIAFATLAHLDKNENKSITLFATHYHSLYEHIKSFKSLQIKHIHCEINPEGILVFSRTLQEGPGGNSYGLLVAKSCGIPQEMITIAERYTKDFKKSITSRYNKSISGTLCEFCNEQQAQETHHLIEQHQGKVENVIINGVQKNIHDKGNLVLLCASCHQKITTDKIQIIKKFGIGQGSKNIILEIKKK